MAAKRSSSKTAKAKLKLRPKKEGKPMTKWEQTGKKIKGTAWVQDSTGAWRVPSLIRRQKRLDKLEAKMKEKLRASGKGIPAYKGQPRDYRGRFTFK